jgi:hypothetical protein
MNFQVKFELAEVKCWYLLLRCRSGADQSLVSVVGVIEDLTQI